MPRKRSTNEQIAFALRQAENGATVDEVCRNMPLCEGPIMTGHVRLRDSATATWMAGLGAKQKGCFRVPSNC
jgi:hypothetical protein